jgi:pyruvate dehydrogenase E2 component (dihydrolipoamide acetyltransferase)
VPEVIMPKMGDAMEEGTLLKWLKSEGEEVSEGDPIAEIETDKVTMELEAEDAGTLEKLLVKEGQEVAMGEPIAVISPKAEDLPTPSTQREELETEGTDTGEPNGPFRASPVVRRIAAEQDIDLSQIQGTGQGGRIIEADVWAAIERWEEPVSQEAETPTESITADALMEEVQALRETVQGFEGQIRELETLKKAAQVASSGGTPGTSPDN